MKKAILFSLVAVAAIGLLLTALTFGVNGIANRNAQKEHERLLKTLLPGSETFTVEPYEGDDPLIRSVHKGESGFVIETAVQGYADEITMLIGVNNEGTVTGLRVLEMHETVGLGAAALTDWEFLAQFLKNKGDAAVGDNIDALTGATVTSKAVARSFNAAVAFVTGADVDSGATSWGG